MINSSNAAVAVFLGVVGLNAFDFSGKAQRLIYYDNKTEFVTNDAVEPKSAVVSPGGTVVNKYLYTKRPGCHGRVTYRLIGHPQGSDGNAPVSDIPIADFVAGWPSATTPKWRVSKATIPEYVPPGKYNLVWVAIATKCDAKDGFRATSPGHVLESWSKPMEIIIKPKGSNQ